MDSEDENCVIEDDNDLKMAYTKTLKKLPNEWRLKFIVQGDNKAEAGNSSDEVQEKRHCKNRRGSHRAMDGMPHKFFKNLFQAQNQQQTAGEGAENEETKEEANTKPVHPLKDLMTQFMGEEKATEV